MALKDLIPTSLIKHPLIQFPDFWNVADENLNQFLRSLPAESSGLTISEDDKNIFIEASLPGLESKDVEVTFDKGVLWVKGERKEEKEDKAKKYYRKATSQFSYRVDIPSQINEKIEPIAEFKNGIMKVTFAKSDTTPAKKIKIKEA